MNKTFFKILFYLEISLFCSGYVIAEELLSDQDLLSEPKAQSAVSSKAKKGQVSILEKKGFWVKIQSGDSLGWTKFSNIKASSSAGIALPETGRSSNGIIVSTSGVRGLDGGDLINAKPDQAEFGKFTSLKTTKDQSLSYAKAGGLETRKINYSVLTSK